MPPRGLALFCALITLAIFSSPASAAPRKVALRFSATTYSVPESAGTFNVTVMRSGNTSAAASVAYSDNGTGTAVGGGTDYSFTGGTLNFAAGQTSKTIPVTITDNSTANAPNKTIVLRLANATPAGSQIKTATTALTIIDNEGPGTLDFSAGSYTVLEGAGAASVTVQSHRRVEPEAERRLRDARCRRRPRDRDVRLLADQPGPDAHVRPG